MSAKEKIKNPIEEYAHKMAVESSRDEVMFLTGTSFGILALMQGMELHEFAAIVSDMDVPMSLDDMNEIIKQASLLIGLSVSSGAFLNMSSTVNDLKKKAVASLRSAFSAVAPAAKDMAAAVAFGASLVAVWEHGVGAFESVQAMASLTNAGKGQLVVDMSKNLGAIFGYSFVAAKSLEYILSGVCDRALKESVSEALEKLEPKI